MFVLFKLRILRHLIMLYFYETFSYGVAVHESEFGLGVGPTFLMNMWCRGNETDLLNCKFAKADDCKPENTAGVICGEY